MAEEAKAMGAAAPRRHSINVASLHAVKLSSTSAASPSPASADGRRGRRRQSIQESLHSITKSVSK